jgi:hypothetical protein
MCAECNVDDKPRRVDSVKKLTRAGPIRDHGTFFALQWQTDFKIGVKGPPPLPGSLQDVHAVEFATMVPNRIATAVNRTGTQLFGHIHLAIASCVRPTMKPSRHTCFDLHG